MCCCGLIGGCIGSLCSGCCCSGLQQCNVKRGAASRIPYVFLMFVFCLFAIIMSLYGEKELYSNHILHFKLTVCNSRSCEGNGSVYRTSFALFIFFLIHAVMVYFVKAFHWLFFVFKFLFLIGFLTLTFWIPNSFFDGYAEFARIASIIFLLLQVIVLIAWAWDVNEKIVNKINTLDREETVNNNTQLEQQQQQQQQQQEENNTKRTAKFYQYLLISITFILYAACIILWVFMFIWFDKNSACSFNEAIISITIVLVVIITILPPILRTGSIFTTAIVGFYMTYLCYAGLASYPRQKCNPFANDRNTASLWIGIIIAAASISYAGFGVSKHDVLFPSNEGDVEANVRNSNNNQVKADDNENIDLQIADNKKVNNYEDDDEDDETEKLDDKNRDIEKAEHSVNSEEQAEMCKEKIEQRANILFYLCMAFASVYLCMLFTNWGTNVATSQGFSKGRISLWVNIGSQWASFILCVWTIIAPRLCPHRFGIENCE